MSEKIDRGFCLQYSKLSYRRKFIRTLWIVPVIGIMFLIPASYIRFGMQRNLWIALTVLATIAQAVFTYNKWKKQALTNTINPLKPATKPSTNISTGE